MPGQPGCHIRFETVIAGELKRCTDQIFAGNVESRAERAKKLYERKIANTKASVCLGTDAPTWSTTMADCMNIDFGGDGRCQVDGKALKKDLTAVHFTLGKDPLDYYVEGARTMLDPTGEIDKYQAHIGGRTASKGSSVWFGDHKQDYSTTMAACMNVVSMETAGSMGGLQGDARAHAKILKEKLHKSSFQIGYDKPTYSVASHDGHPPVDTKAARRILSKEVMDDLRKAHFDFGSEETIYETDMMRSMKNGEITPAFVACMKEDKAAADALAMELKVDHCRGVVTGVYPQYC